MARPLRTLNRGFELAADDGRSMLLHDEPGDRDRESPMTKHMQALFILALVLGATLDAGRAHAQTAISASVQIGDFHVAVANYYRVPEREVIILRERRIPDDEIPVALFIAQRAAVRPATIVDLRLRGNSWWDISVHFGLEPDVYYVPVAVTPGPPYGKAYGHYKKPRNRWNTIVLSDADIVNLVQLRFLSDHYHVPPERIIELRRDQGDFVAIHVEVSGRRSAGAKGDHRGSNGNGRGRGRGR